MPIVFENYTRQSTNGTASSITLQKPTGTVSGDVLLLLVGNENSAAGEGFGSITGWIQLANNGNADSDCYLGAYYRIYDGTEADSVVVPFLGSDDGHGWYARISGVDLTDPINQVQQGTPGVGDSEPGKQIFGGGVEELVLGVSLLSFDGSDADPFVVSGSGWLMEDWLESPDPSDSGGASSGAFALIYFAGDGANNSDSPWWTWNGTSDGRVSSTFVFNPKLPIEGSALLERSQDNLICTGFIEPIEGSALLERSKNSLVIEGYVLNPTLGTASLQATSEVVGAQSIIFSMEPPTFYGSALLERSKANLTVNGAVSGIQFGQVSLLNTSEFVIEGILVGANYNSASIVSQSILTIAGILTEPSLGRRIDDLEIKVTLLEEQINDVPEGTDFLKAIDIASFFTTAERGILYGV